MPSTITIPSAGPRPATTGPAPEVWVLTNAPSPYQAELFSAITADDAVELTVRFMRPSSPAGDAVQSSFDNRNMWSPVPGFVRDEFRLHPRAIWEVAFGRFDCYVLSGLYTSITFICCAGILSLRGKPWFVWMERPRGFRSNRLGLAWVRQVLDKLRIRLLRSSTRVLCIGSAAQTAYAQLGIPPTKLDVLPYCCNLSRYDTVTDSDIAAWRQALGIGESVVFLYSGQLIPRKGVDTLLQAFEQVAAQDEAPVLVLLGDGPLRADLEQMVPPQFRSRVRFLGHQPQDMLPTVFRSADAFIFPSRHDGWAVVINEACAAGLPVIATEQTGAAHDLIEPGQSGYRLQADDIQAFCDAMRTLTRDPDLRHRMGRRSRELVETISPESGARRFADAIGRALQIK